MYTACSNACSTKYFIILLLHNIYSVIKMHLFIIKCYLNVFKICVPSQTQTIKFIIIILCTACSKYTYSLCSVKMSSMTTHQKHTFHQSLKRQKRNSPYPNLTFLRRCPFIVKMYTVTYRVFKIDVYCINYFMWRVPSAPIGLDPLK